MIRIVGTFLLYIFFTTFWSQKAGESHLLYIYNPIQIVSPKNTPPYYAFKDIEEFSRRSLNPFTKAKEQVNLRAGDGIGNASINLSSMELTELVVESSVPELKKVEYASAAQSNVERLEISPEHLKAKIHKLSSLDIPKSGYQRIVGPVEICCGLALTNEHKFEIRRVKEGVYQERGVVNHVKGEFSIDVADMSGEIEASLYDSNGRILGVGSYRISDHFSNKLDMSGPMLPPILKVAPPKGVYGRVSSLLSGDKKEALNPPKGTQVASMAETNSVNFDKGNQFTDPIMTKYSETELVARADRHWTTSTIAISGFENDLHLFPQKIISSISDLMHMEIHSVIWGKVTQSERPVSGIKIESESHPDAQIVYLNEIFLPDKQLNGTSTNGIFIIVNPRDGFHSLVARRSDEYFGYINTIVREGAVSLADIKSTMKIISAPIRVFDAFSGAPVSAQIEAQSLPNPIKVTGSDFVLLPATSRLGLAFARPETEGYIPAQFSYNDMRGFIHIPMIQESWLNYVKVRAKINENPRNGIVIGFVPDENFETYMVGLDLKNHPPIFYFNSAGEIIDKKEGPAGGGFIIFDVPINIHEFAVYGQKDHLLTTRIAPVDSGQITVLNF